MYLSTRGAHPRYKYQDGQKSGIVVGLNKAGAGNGMIGRTTGLAANMAVFGIWRLDLTMPHRMLIHLVGSIGAKAGTRSVKAGVKAEGESVEGKAVHNAFYHDREKRD